MRLRKTISTLFLALSLSLSLSAASPKYIFYFIGDGMGVGAVSLTQLYNRTVLGADTLLKMMQMPYMSLAFTHSASSPVTDSAAAGTALATGNKTSNGMIGVTPDTATVISIASKLHDQGYGVGLVTTVAPDDATPASFYAHQPHRSMFYEIGCDAAKSGFEFLAGANLRGLKDKEGKPTDLLDQFRRNNVAVVHGLDSLAMTDSKKVMLLGINPFSNNDMGFVIDSIDRQMSLLQMTDACINHLQRHTPEAFFMMVEGGSIDHAGHANDPAALVAETIAFDQALSRAFDFYLAHPDETLIIVTADHETGGLALANRNYHYDIHPEYLQYPRASKEAMWKFGKSLMASRMVITWDDIKQHLTEKLSLYDRIPVSDKEDELMKTLCEQGLEARANGDYKGAEEGFGKMLNEAIAIISRMSGAGWTTGDHSGAPVPVFAVGQGADQFSSMQDNTEIPKKILSISLGQK